MPELPEVEIAARNLRRWSRGRSVVSARVLPTRIAGGAAASAIERALQGRRIARVDRRGKWIRLSLDDGARVFSHLGMSGKWVRRAFDAETERWERARIDLRGARGQASIRYVDPRMFGRLVLAREDLAEWSALGPDPLVDGVDARALGARLESLRRTVKEALMDQAVLAGVGNIQATEALWRARIDPRSRTDALSTSDVRAIAKGIRAAIAATLAHENGPEITYVEEAGAPNPFRIYGHQGRPCPRCRTPLVKIVLGGRGTVFCAGCQRRVG